MNELLSKLSIFDSTLTLDVRTLRETPQKTTVFDMGNGKYFHFGVVNCLTDVLFTQDLLHMSNKLVVHCRIDWLPLFKSSKKCVWPIMISVSNSPSVSLVWVYVNIDSNNIVNKFSKPRDSNEFLVHPIKDLQYLKETGFLF